MTQQERNYNAYLKMNGEEYTNKWVAIVDDHIVSVRDQLKEAYKEAQQKYPNKIPLIAKIPSRKIKIYQYKNRESS